MDGRVLSTAEARQAIQAMQRVINGPLMEQIRALNSQGQTLSNASVWDGPLAREFRSTWPDMNRKLLAAQEELERLRGRTQKINEEIMRAGGAAG